MFSTCRTVCPVRAGRALITNWPICRHDCQQSFESITKWAFPCLVIIVGSTEGNRDDGMHTEENAGLVCVLVVVGAEMEFLDMININFIRV